MLLGNCSVPTRYYTFGFVFLLKHIIGNLPGKTMELRETYCKSATFLRKAIVKIRGL